MCQNQNDKNQVHYSKRVSIIENGRDQTYISGTTSISISVLIDAEALIIISLIFPYKIKHIYFCSEK